MFQQGDILSRRLQLNSTRILAQLLSSRSPPGSTVTVLPTNNGDQNGVDTSDNGGDTRDASLHAKTRRLEAQLGKFYEVHAPDKSGVAREVALHYVGDEDALNDTLREKYGHCLTSSPASGGIREEQPAQIIELKVPSHLRSPHREMQETVDNTKP